MKPAALITLLGLGLGVTALVMILRQPDPTAAAAVVAPADTIPERGPHWTDEEVFRRAFWRRPTATDRILHAERRELAANAAGAPQSWQWFLAVHPSTELLTSLRDPDTFGLALTPTATARPWTTDPAPPDWFPASAPLDGFEVLQAGAGHLTLLYRPHDNVLFAMDSGGGFATAARPLHGPPHSPSL